MDKTAIKQVISEYFSDVRVDEPMSEHTSFQVGGPADIMVLPKTKEELLHGYRALVSFGCPVFIMGRGTDLLVRSGGMRGVVLKLADNFSGVTVEDNCVTVLSGTPLSTLVHEAMLHGLGGAPFLAGIPGTLGGALAMNAGAYGGEIGPFVEEVYLLSRVGEVTLHRVEMRFGYRHSTLSDYPFVAVGAKLRLSRVPAEQTEQEVEELAEKRRSKQPLEYPSAGSTFKRPPGHFAGALIDQAGLRGICVGGAQVSEKHAGFIINKGGATPEDILELIALVQSRVFDRSGVMLEPEIKIIGET